MKNKEKVDGNIGAWWFYSPIILAPIIILLPALIPGRSLFWGITSIQFIPWHWEALRMIQAGEIPLWNVFNGMGSPLAANYQSCIFYPPTWLTFLAGSVGGLPWLAWSHGWLVAGHLMWAGWGMKKLMARLGLSPIPQLIGGLSYGLCGYLVSRGSFLTMVQAASWIPWILLAACQFAIPIGGNPANLWIPFSPRSIIWLALAFAGQWLSGHAQLAWYTLLYCLAWLVTGALINGGSKRLLHVAIPVAISGLLGFLLSSIQMIPTLEYFLQSQRSGAIDYQTALSYSFWPWRVITLIFPDIFGNPGAGDYWGYGSFWEDAVYTGLLPLVLAVYYVIRRLKHKEVSNPYQSFVWFSLISIGVVVLLALGWNTPVFPWLFEHVLTFGFFNGPARWMILFEVNLILLAGLGAQEWLDHAILRRKWVNLNLTGVAAMLLTAAAAWIFLPEIKLSFKAAVIASGLLLIGYFILALRKPKEPGASGILRWRYLIVIWLAVDLIWAGGRSNPAVSAANYHVNHPLTENPQNVGRYYIPSEDEKKQRFDRFFLFEDIRPRPDWQNLTGTLLPDINMLSRVPMLNNFDPMVPDRFSEFLADMEKASPEAREELLSLAGVDHIARVDPENPQNQEWTQRETYPRARLFHCAEDADADHGRKWMISAAESGRLDTVLLLENTSLNRTTCNNSPARLTGLIDLSPLSNRQIYEVAGNMADGWLFIADTWYPGWKAKLDGQPIEIKRADYVFMAVPVPAGDHQIELEFQGDAFIAGLWLTVSGFCMTIILGFFVKNSKGVGK